MFAQSGKNTVERVLRVNDIIHWYHYPGETDDGLLKIVDFVCVETELRVTLGRQTLNEIDYQCYGIRKSEDLMIIHVLIQSESLK